MSAYEEKRIGEQIVSRIDTLVNLIKLALYEKEKRDELLSKGHDIIQELSLLLEKFLGASEHYIIQAIRELLKQRLSDEESEVTRNFFNILEEMIFREKGLPSASTSRQVALNAFSEKSLSCDDVQRALSFLFPEVKVLKNYRFCGVNFTYYIPSYCLAVVDEAKEKGSQALKEYFCKSRGIQLIKLNTQKMSGYREIARYIKGKLR